MNEYFPIESFMQAIFLLSIIGKLELYFPTLIFIAIFSSSSDPQSLYSLWTTRLEALNSVRCKEFAYRAEHGNKAPLYKHLTEEAER